jgi:drug/metabolite transporter (DMT)-like permease
MNPIQETRKYGMGDTARPTTWKVLLAFSIIYFVWGSTYYAIRVGVHEVPPFLLAAMRFFASGLILLAWLRATGTPLPTSRQWAGASILGTIIFLVDYGCVFWAEQRVPSGITAVILACIPVFMTLLEITVLRTQRLTFRLGIALLTGIIGVAVLMNPSRGMGESPIDRAGTLALILAAFSWSVAAIATRRIPLPDSKPMSAAAQMLTGGAQLFVLAAVTGEFGGFHIQTVSRNAWFALVYLIVFGSIIAFTAYVWLLHYESPTKVGTYAYVNPVIAVGVGYFMGGEIVGRRTLVGALLILASVIAITTTPKKIAADDPAKLAVAGVE